MMLQISEASYQENYTGSRQFRMFNIFKVALKVFCKNCKQLLSSESENKLIWTFSYAAHYNVHGYKYAVPLNIQSYQLSIALSGRLNK